MDYPSAQPQGKSSSPRILELDALRGLAAVAVVLFHYTTRYDQLFGHTAPLATSLSWGDYGVDLFFMLSGFVMLMTLDRTTNAWQFAWGRFSRLYPAYWAAAALTFAVVACFGLPGQEVTLGEAIVNLTMVQSLLGVPHIDGVYWSLQAELIFYGNMLVLYRCGAFRRPITTVTIWITAALTVHFAQGFAETAWPLAAGALSKLATVTSLKFIPLFGIGILFYTSRQTPQVFAKSVVAVAYSLAAFALVKGIPTAGVDALLAILLLLAVHGRLPVLAARPLVALGALSYTLYLVHQNIGYVLIGHFEQMGVAPWLAIPLAVLASLVLAAQLHRLVEKPAMRSLRGMETRVLWRSLRPAPADS